MVAGEIPPIGGESPSAPPGAGPGEPRQQWAKSPAFPGEIPPVPCASMMEILYDVIAAGLAGWAVIQAQQEAEAEAEAALVPELIPVPVEEEG